MHRVEVLPAELRQILFFDLDDTLIHCNKYFNEILSRFADWMIARFQGTTRDEVLEKQVEFDLAGVRKVGFVKDRFPESLVETYDYYSAVTGRETSAEERERLFKLGQSVYEFPNIEPYPHAWETLERLKEEGHELYLYTGGETAIQRKKVKQMGLDAFFGDRVFISSHKTTEVLESILSREKFDRVKTWMIGNSIRTDVVPALEPGINAIHIPAISEWQYNVVDISVRPKRAFLRLKSLLEVPPAIRQYSLV